MYLLLLVVGPLICLLQLLCPRHIPLASSLSTAVNLLYALVLLLSQTVPACPDHDDQVAEKAIFVRNAALLWAPWLQQ